MDIRSIQQTILLVAMVLLSIMMILALIISIMGPRFTDRLVAVSMINTEVNGMICLLSVYFMQGYLLDVALVYGMIGFLAIVVLAKIYMKSYLEKNKDKFDKEIETKAVSSEDGDR